MIKGRELADPESCLNKAMDDEPLFVLKATDIRAPQTIRHWVSMNKDLQPEEKLKEALKMADSMDEWRKDNITLNAPIRVNINPCLVEDDILECMKEEFPELVNSSSDVDDHLISKKT